MTIIPENALKSDPQQLLYNFPGIHPIKYTKLSSEYHHWRAVAAAEKTARIFGRLLVPCTMIHWERKLKFEDRRIQIGKNAYFALSREEMTSIEFKKYSAAAYEDKEKIMA
ncbi:hypothetical protein NSQ91_31910 [Paenibacillus sp. FSL R7-0048]|jgi:hypothetical protein|uniref:hypothetical protein n=1 Tax=unclassified Paenibacillus TaxID=185978 RepID=UPI0030F5F5EC